MVAQEDRADEDVNYCGSYSQKERNKAAAIQAKYALEAKRLEVKMLREKMKMDLRQEMIRQGVHLGSQSFPPMFATPSSLNPSTMQNSNMFNIRKTRMAFSSFPFFGLLYRPFTFVHNYYTAFSF